MFNRLVVASLFTFIGLSLAVHARADESSHRAATLQLCDVMDIERTMQVSMSRILDLQLQQAPQLQQQRATFEKFFTKYLSWNALKEDFIQLYMQAFSESELRDMIAFYQTPTGKKATHLMPALMQRGAELSLAQLAKHQDELNQMLQSSASPTGGQKKKSGVPGPGQPGPASPGAGTTR